LRASSSVLRFPGFTALYTEQKDAGDDEEKTPVLPSFERNDELEALGVFPEQHFTQPPLRFTEATLIKYLEQWGIGRPSTYAPTISTIQAREYVVKTKGNFTPTDLGMIVNDLIAQHFPDIVDLKFTAKFEGELDDIASAEGDWVGVVREFYTPFAKNLEKAIDNVERVKLADELTEEVCPKCGRQMAIKAGRFGKFLACTGYPECKSTMPYKLKTGVKCPECEGELIKRVGKKNRAFYGCSRYPDCRFISNFKPLPAPCPSCGGLLTEYREKWARCIKCGQRIKQKEE
jgi:DNA topoisomerase-1